MKPGTSRRCVSRDVHTCSKSVWDPGTTLKRFIAINMSSPKGYHPRAAVISPLPLPVLSRCVAQCCPGGEGAGVGDGVRVVSGDLHQSRAHLPSRVEVLSRLLGYDPATLDELRQTKVIA